MSSHSKEVTPNTKPSWFRNTLVIAVLVRVVESVLLRTYGNPDEYWQGPEVAHRLIWGSGFVTWEWLPEYTLRSYLHPIMIAAGYLPLTFFSRIPLDIFWLIPRLMQGLLTALSDIAAILVSRRLFASKKAEWFTLFALQVNWFSINFAARTVSNNMEMLFVIAASYFWLNLTDFTFDVDIPSSIAKSDKSLSASHRSRRIIYYATVTGILAGFGFVIRPSSIIFWAFFGLCCFIRHSFVDTFLMALKIVPGFVISLAISLFIDAKMYGKLTFPFYNFFTFNLVSGYDKLFGVYHPLWILYNALPATVNVHLPAMILGMLSTLRSGRVNQFIVGFFGYVLVLSTVAHKEHRFLLPLLPFAAIFAGRGFDILETALVQQERDSVLLRSLPRSLTAPLRTLSLSPFFSPARAVRESRLRALLTFVTVITALVGIFLLQGLQRGPVRAMEYVARAAEAAEDAHGPQWLRQKMDVHVLMVCHSVPFYSIVHRSVHMWQIDCSPAASLAIPGQFRDPICKYTGCCADSTEGATEPGVPRITESHAFTHYRQSMIESVYGPRPQQPFVCNAVFDKSYASNPSPAAPPSTLNDLQMSYPKHPWGYDLDSFITHPVEFANTFGNEQCKSDLETTLFNLPKYEANSSFKRALPSHIVMFDTDANSPFFSEWLKSNGYKKVFESFFSFFEVNAHSDTATPSSVYVFEHSCWNSVVSL